MAITHTFTQASSAYEPLTATALAITGSITHGLPAVSVAHVRVTPIPGCDWCQHGW